MHLRQYRAKRTVEPVGDFLKRDPEFPAELDDLALCRWQGGHRGADRGTQFSLEQGRIRRIRRRRR